VADRCATYANTAPAHGSKPAPAQNEKRSWLPTPGPALAPTLRRRGKVGRSASRDCFGHAPSHNQRLAVAISIIAEPTPDASP